MTTLREAAQQALEAMESVEWYGAGSGWMVDADAIEGAITALKAALAEPEGGGNLPPPLQEATVQQQLEDTPPSDYRRGYCDGFRIGKREGRIEAEDALAEPVQDKRTTVADLRDAMWLDPECADKGACQSLKFKCPAEPVQEPTRSERMRAAGMTRRPRGWIKDGDEPVQEPVAWRTFDGEGGYDYRTYEDNEDYAAEWAKRNPRHVAWVEPLYTAPPQRKPLTDEELDALAIDEDGLPNSHIEFARAIEQAHGIKE